ncbi:MAG: inorganic diphosphatase [Patescibacteria group bacterium]
MNIEKLSKGKNPPEEINVVVEIPQGSYIKYEMDKDSGFIMVDRFAFTAMAYPFNYGFMPGTQAADGDPTDILVISTYPVHPGCVIPSRPIGMLEMEDEEGIDTKILAVPTAKVDAFYADVNDIEDLPEAILNKIRHFFERYKELEKGKWVKLKDFKGKQDAFNDITNSLA